MKELDLPNTVTVEITKRGISSLVMNNRLLLPGESNRRTLIQLGFTDVSSFKEYVRKNPGIVTLYSRGELVLNPITESSKVTVPQPEVPSESHLSRIAKSVSISGGISDGVNVSTESVVDEEPKEVSESTDTTEEVIKPVTEKKKKGKK